MTTTQTLPSKFPPELEAGARAMYEYSPHFPNGALSQEYPDGRIERVTPPIAWSNLRDDQRNYYRCAFAAGLAAIPVSDEMKDAMERKVDWEVSEEGCAVIFTAAIRYLTGRAE